MLQKEMEEDTFIIIASLDAGKDLKRMKAKLDIFKRAKQDQVKQRSSGSLLHSLQDKFKENEKDTTNLSND